MTMEPAMHPDTSMKTTDLLMDVIPEVLSSFDLPGYECARRYGGGHINDTFLLEKAQEGGSSAPS